LVFVVHTLDGCRSETELADLISLLGQPLREHNLPVTRILLTSLPEEHICDAFQGADTCPLPCEIPMNTTGEGAVSGIPGNEAPGSFHLCITSRIFSTRDRDHPCYEGFCKLRKRSRGTKLVIFRSSQVCMSNLGCPSLTESDSIRSHAQRYMKGFLESASPLMIKKAAVFEGSAVWSHGVIRRLETCGDVRIPGNFRDSEPEQHYRNVSGLQPTPGSSQLSV
jgi:hypothetical protein